MSLSATFSNQNEYHRKRKRKSSSISFNRDEKKTENTLPLVSCLFIQTNKRINQLHCRQSFDSFFFNQFFFHSFFVVLVFIASTPSEKVFWPWFYFSLMHFSPSFHLSDRDHINRLIWLCMSSVWRTIYYPYDRLYFSIDAPNS